jgi:asparagine synthetase B (glutamine-hydrolysing)
MTKSYLILNRGAQKIESGGFEHDQNRWRPEGTSIDILINKTIVLKKPNFLSVPLFYANTPDVFIASRYWTTVVELLREFRVTLGVNLSYIYDYLQFQCPFTNATFCKNIYYLRNGEVVIINSNGQIFSSLPSFDPLDFPFEKDFLDIKKSLYLQLSDVNCLDTVFHISSGLDSSILSILASEIHTDHKIHVATCKTRGKGTSDELGIARRLSEDFDFNLHLFDFRDVDIFASGRKLIHDVLGYPIAHPSHLTRYLLDAEISEFGRTIVTGRGPDEYLAGYAWHDPEFSDPAKHFERVCVSSDTLLKTVITDTLDIHSSVGRHMFWRSTKSLSLQKRIQYDLWSIFEAWNIIDGAIENALDIHISNPFIHPELNRMLFSLPDSYRCRDGQKKWLLREIFSDRYPNYVLEQPKQGFRIDLQPYLSDYSDREIMAIIFKESPFADMYLNREGCLYMIRSTIDGEANYGWQIWSLYLCAVAYEWLTNP